MKEKKDDFSFCFKKASGLKLVNPNERLVEVYDFSEQEHFRV